MSTLTTLLDEGRIDDDGAALLYRTVGEVARQHSYPPPPDYNSWNAEARVSAAHDFLVGHRATERLVYLAATSADDAAFERQLRASVLNWLRDQARQTVVGKQIRRIKEVVRETPEFVVSDNGVRLRTHPDTATTRSEADLQAAAHTVAAGPRRWRPDARREGPVADREVMVELVAAVLRAAGARVDWGQLGRVVARRFDLLVTPVALPIDGLDPHSADPYATADVGDQVAVILEQLTEHDRLVLPWLDVSSREAARHLPWGHSTIANRQRSLKDFLATVVPDSREGAVILAELLQRVTAAPANGKGS